MIGLLQSHLPRLPLSALTPLLLSLATPATATERVPADALDRIVPELASKRVVYIGEQHDRLDHHLNQLTIIEALHARDPKLAIGMEAFDQRYQAHLDEYIAGNLSTRALLEKTDYFTRWQWDFRLYAPILAFARAHGVPIIALNVPRETVTKVSNSGLDSLTPEERKLVPTRLDDAGPDYRAWLGAIFGTHGSHLDPAFENFVAAQTLWDQAMAERAAAFLQQNPDHRLVVLTGTGHVTFRSAIPDRLQRQIRVDDAVVLNDWLGAADAKSADYVIVTQVKSLPPAGKMGLYVAEDDGGVRVKAVEPKGPGVAAGIVPEDWLLEVDGHSIRRITDVKVALWDKKPGDTLEVRVRRQAGATAPQERAFALQLH